MCQIAHCFRLCLCPSRGKMEVHSRCFAAALSRSKRSNWGAGDPPAPNRKHGSAWKNNRSTALVQAACRLPAFVAGIQSRSASLRESARRRTLQFGARIRIRIRESLRKADTFGHKRFACQERIRMVTLQDIYSGASHGGQPNELRAPPGKVFLPEILAGMIQPGRPISLWVDSRKIGS